MFDRFKEKKTLKKISLFERIDGWLTLKEALGLYQVAKKLPENAVVVEIGSWQGKSTFCIAKGLRSGKVYAIDPFNADGGDDSLSQEEYTKKKAGGDLLEIFKNNMQQGSVLEKIIVRQGYSGQFYNEFDKINFLFIDGDHSVKGCRMDFDQYAHKIVPGGFIAFHDYYKDRPELGPTHVVDNFVLPSRDFIFFNQADSLWIAQKK